MKVKEMKIQELQNYAQKYGFDSIQFKIINTGGDIREGRWVDAYFGLFTFNHKKYEGKVLSVEQWLDLFGDKFNFKVLKKRKLKV